MLLARQRLKKSISLVVSKLCQEFYFRATAQHAQVPAEYTFKCSLVTGVQGEDTAVKKLGIKITNVIISVNSVLQDFISQSFSVLWGVRCIYVITKYVQNVNQIR